MSVYSDNRLNRQHENEAWYKLFNLIEDNKRILDIGCSSGKLGSELRKEKNAYVVGIDIDKDDVELATNNLDEAYVMNIENDDISKLGKFDTVIMADVIEHLFQPVEALKKIKGVLKPGGKLVFSIPNMANATIRLELLKGSFEYKDWGLLDKTHIRFFDESEVYKVFSNAGYKVTEMDCTIRSIPDHILKRELSDIGIELTDKLKKHLMKPNAVTYQFIGVAQKGRPGKDLPIKSSSSLDSVSREIDRIRASLEEEINKVHKELSVERKKYIKLLGKYHEIIDSRSWRLYSSIVKIKKRLL